MLTIITDPVDYSLSKNPIVAEIETDSYLQLPGMVSSLNIKVGTGSGANAVGGTLTISWPLDSVTFTVATTPDDSGYQVRPKGALSSSAFAAQLIVDFGKNYKLSENFTFGLSGTNIIFESRLKSPSYEMTFSSLNFGYVIDTSLLFLPGTAPVYAPSYKMKADLWMEDSFNAGNYNKKGSIELDPLNNRCIFDFQTEINANLNYNLPTYGQTTPSDCATVIKRFYLKYLEKYGSPVQEREINTTSVGYALKAGIPKEEFVGTTDQINSRYRTAGIFLTRQPRIKRIRENQQEFLYYVQQGGNIDLKITIYKKDGTAPVVTSPGTTAGLSYRVKCFPVGFTALGLSSSVPWSNVKKYEILLVDDHDYVTPKSEIFTFVPEADSFIDEHYILFSNSDGGIDTLRLKGLQETSFEIEKETVQITTLFNTPVVNGEFSEVSHQKTDRYKISTGWVTKAQADWIEDLFLAEKKFIDRDGMFIPIIISTTVQKKYDSKSTLFTYEFEYSTAFKNRVPKSLV